MKLLNSCNITQNSLIKFLPSGKYVGIFALVSGTNQAGQTLNASQLGTFRLLHRGRQIVYIPFDRLQFINGIKHGSVDASSTAGSNFYFSAFLPFQYFNDKSNILYVENDEEYQLEWNNFYQAGSTVIANGNVYLYLVEGEGIQKYHLSMNTLDFNAVNGTGSQQLQVENLIELLIENNSNLSQISLLLDGKPFISDASRRSLIDWTNLFNAIETYNDSISYINIVCSTTGDILESLADNAILNYLTQNSISPLKLITVSIDFTPDKEVASSQSYVSDFNRVIQEKSAKGKIRAVRALQTESE